MTPTPAVISMASAPQKVTRITLCATLAPPARGQRTRKHEEDQRSSNRALRERLFVLTGNREPIPWVQSSERLAIEEIGR